MDELRRTAESYLRNELVRLEGIADVKLLGQEVKEVIIETNQYVLEAFGLTPSTITNKIQEYNRNISSGSITEMGTKYIVKGISEFGSLEDISKVIVAYKQPEVLETSSPIQERVPVFLKDIAAIKYKNKISDNIVHVNQRRSMALAVYKETKYNTVKAVDDLMLGLEAIKRIMNDFPGVNTICGLSNVSYGLPERRLINRNFLALCISYGLSSVILDPTDKQLMSTLLTVEMLLGRDEYCDNFIDAYQNGRIAG